MMNNFYKKTKKGYLTIWAWNYIYEDDLSYNLGYAPEESTFLGTKKEFEDYRIEAERNYGAHFEKLKKKHCTEKQYKIYKMMG